MSQIDVSHLTQRVMLLEAKVEALAQHLGIELDVERGPATAATTTGAGPEVTDPAPGITVAADVVALARAGKKIEAIKRYRELTGLDLKSAKDIVEQIR